jgi:hypothetical protein
LGCKAKKKKDCNLKHGVNYLYHPLVHEMLRFASRRRDISVGIATGYGLDGPGIESLCEARFFAHVQTGPETHPASCTMGTGSFTGVKRPGRDADHTPPSSSEVTKV